MLVLASTMLGACYDPVVDATEVFRLELELAPGSSRVASLEVWSGSFGEQLRLSVERVDATETGTVTVRCEDMRDDAPVPSATATLDFALDDVASAAPVMLDAFGYFPTCTVSLSADAGAQSVTVAFVAEVDIAFRQDFIGNTPVHIVWRER